MKMNDKKEVYKISLGVKESLNTEQILKQLDEQNLLIKKLKEELLKTPWEKHNDVIRH